MKAWQGSVAVSDYEGIVSPAYFIYRFTDNIFFKRYFHYLLRGCYKDEFMRLSGGIRVGQWDLPSVALDNTMILIPPLHEQRLIADFLDAKCTEIDSIIASKKAQLETLYAYKKSLIFEYVTGKKEVPEAVTVVSIDPHVLRLAIIADTLKELNVKRKRKGKRALKGKVVSQKFLYLSDEYLEHGVDTPYHRYQNGPLDLQLDSYINVLVSNGWYEVDTSDGAKNLVEGKNHAEFLEQYGEQLAQYKSSIQSLIQYFGAMRRTQIERFATLFAVWNDLIIDGNPTPSDAQIIREATTNWTPNKGDIPDDTWQNTLTKMRRDKIIPKGLGQHTLPKPEGGKSDA